MSKADEMLSGLGYMHMIETDTIVDISGISMKELQAINQKCKELGWIE